MFIPDRLNANIGDHIRFDFHGLNHTLTQSTLENPCSPLYQFDTGFGQFNPDDRDGLSVTLTVNTLRPQWFFCRQTSPSSHCHAGMVFAINPGNRMQEFRRNAMIGRGTSYTTAYPKYRTTREQSSSATPKKSVSSTTTTHLFTPTGSVLSPSPVPSTTTPIRDGKTIVVLTKTVTKDCYCYDTLAVHPTSSPTSKRNTPWASSSNNIHSRIMSRMGAVTLGHLLLLLF